MEGLRKVQAIGCYSSEQRKHNFGRMLGKSRRKEDEYDGAVLCEKVQLGGCQWAFGGQVGRKRLKDAVARIKIKRYLSEKE